MRSIIVTSPNKATARGLTAANLALTMAQEFQQRVLLLDGRSPPPVDSPPVRASRTRPGLSDVLAGRESIEDAIVRVAQHELAIVPAGPVPVAPGRAPRLDCHAARARRAAHAASTGSSSTCRPSRRSPTSRSRSGMVDGLLMVVRAGVTPKPAIERALSGSTCRRSRPRAQRCRRQASHCLRLRRYGYVGG
jgi:receptor protein-tyrosine kinase/non-specific protein-tyrosine kinase